MNQYLWIFAALLAVSINSASQAKSYTYKYAKQVSSDDFQSTLADHRVTFINFYSPTCDYCHQIAPQFDTLAYQFSNVQGAAIRLLDISKEPQIQKKQNIQIYPTLRIFIGGQHVDYEGKPQSEPMVQFVSQFLMARLLVIPKHSDARKPAVIVTGIKAESHLQALPVLFTRYPIYYSAEGTQFTVQILDDKEVRHYSGEQKLISIADWLEEQTVAILVSLGTSKVPKKLKKAMQKQLSILGLVNKGEKGQTKQALSILQQSCKDITEYVCGYLNKGEDDYKHLTTLIADPQESRNRLIWIDTKNKNIFLSDQDVNQLSTQKISKFVSDVQQGRQAVHNSYSSTSSSKNEEQQL